YFYALLTHDKCTSLIYFFFSFLCFYVAIRYLHSFPTRRSSDLMFPSGMRNDVQVVTTVLSIDGVNDPDMVAVNAATMSGSLTPRSEEHTSELQSRGHLVCRLLLEKKKN